MAFSFYIATDTGWASYMANITHSPETSYTGTTNIHELHEKTISRFDFATLGFWKLGERVPSFHTN